MVRVPDARDLLAEARRLFDTPANGLASGARQAWRTGFAGGAEWLRRALGALRGQAPEARAAFGRLGGAKYGLATAAAAACGWLACTWSPWLLPLAVVAFYAVEVRMVFAFPLALDGSPRPLRDSHRLLAATMPAVTATQLVMQIAAAMLTGGLLGRGFVRSWCVGCLAVVLWYEQARRVEATA